MLEKIRQLLGRTSHPLNLITINSQVLLSNYKYLNEINRKVKVAPVVKSNAYGHGIQIIGKLFNQVDAPFLAVDSLYEAFQLQKAGVKTPILIMGYIDPQSLRIKKLPFMYAVYDLALAEAINRYQKGAKIHIFLDTGMNREGVRLVDLEVFLEIIGGMKNIKVVGLMHHLAMGYDPVNPVTKRQLKEFLDARQICKKMSIKLEYLHIGGSNALFNLDLKDYNVVRVGMGNYGRDPKHANKNLKPALKVTSKIVQIKEIKQGDRVGYDGSFQAQKQMTIGIVPYGYFDGLDRRLSNKGVVLVEGVVCKILGYASMNMTTIDLTNVNTPQVGQEVVIFSDNEDDPNSIVNAAKLAGTTAYDLLVHLTQTTKRIVI